MRSRGCPAVESPPRGSVGKSDGQPLDSIGESRSEPLETFSWTSSARVATKRTPLAKRGFDVLLSGLGLVLALPVGAVIALAVKLQDGGPVFFFQERVGKDGVRFRSFKFRSMVVDAEARERYAPVQASEHDPRVTPVGKLLRATAMDELPQLWNIFRGDMSFVGPRALAPREVETRSDGTTTALEEIPGYAERHAVVPGLTGIAQIFAARDVPRRQKFRYDRIYVDNRSLCLDLKLILLSFWITFRGKWEVRGDKL